MDKRLITVFNTIKEYEVRGEPIWGKELANVLKGKMSPSVVHRKINQLIECGNLYTKNMKMGRSIHKLLFINPDKPDYDGRDRIDMLIECQNRCDEKICKMMDMILFLVAMVSDKNISKSFEKRR